MHILSLNHLLYSLHCIYAIEGDKLTEYTIPKLNNIVYDSGDRLRTTFLLEAFFHLYLEENMGDCHCFE